MKSRLIAVSVTAIAALFLVASSVEQAAAQRGGRDGSGPSAGGSRGPSGGPSAGGGRGQSAGPRFDGGGPGARSFSPRDGSRGFSRDGSRGYSYAPRFDDRDGRRHGRRFRGDRFIYGAVPFYGAYEYGPCAYYYGRAVATGSSYWWDRYYACAGGDYD